jgi:hypothetical protein
MIISYSLLNKSSEDLVLIVMQLLKCNQELEAKVAALAGGHPDAAVGSLRDRIVRTCRHYRHYFDS